VTVGKPLRTWLRPTKPSRAKRVAPRRPPEGRTVRPGEGHLREVEAAESSIARFGEMELSPPGLIALPRGEMRIAVMLDDPDFMNVLAAVLRQQGHLVVEPEIAEVKIRSRRSPDGIRIEYAERVCEKPDIIALLPAPVTVRQLASAIHRLTP
jgi:hypothetical protein